MADREGTFVRRTPAWRGVIPAAALVLFLPLVAFGQPNLIFRDGFQAGFVVAARFNPREINIYRIDQPNVPIQTIPAARFTSGDGIFDHAGNRIGTHWSDGVQGNQYPTRLGIFTTSRPVVLGSAAGHEYEYLGYIGSAPPRVFFRDVASPTNITIRSAKLDGTDSRELLAGCLSLDRVVPRPDGSGQIASAKGAAFRCDKGEGVGNKMYYSDGASPAVELAGAGSREPKVLTSTHLVLFNPSGTPALFTQSITAPFTEAKLLAGSGVDRAGVHVNPDGIAWMVTFNAADGALPWRAWVVDTANPASVATQYQAFLEPLFKAVSPDGFRFATIYPQQAGTGMPDRSWTWQFHPTTPALPAADVTPPGAVTTVSDIRFLDNGKILVTRGTSLNPTGIFLHNADGSNVLQKGDVGLRVLGLRGEYALFGDANSSGVLQSVNLAVGGGLWTMETKAAAPVPSFVSPPGATPQYVTYVNDLLNEAWIATLDPDLGIKQRIDLTGTNLVSKVSEGIGNRVFLVLNREEGATDQDDIVMVDLDTLVTTPIVSGPTSDYGLYFPN